MAKLITSWLAITLHSSYNILLFTEYHDTMHHSTMVFHFVQVWRSRTAYGTRAILSKMENHCPMNIGLWVAVKLKYVCSILTSWNSIVESKVFFKVLLIFFVFLLWKGQKRFEFTWNCLKMMKIRLKLPKNAQLPPKTRLGWTIPTWKPAKQPIFPLNDLRMT